MDALLGLLPWIAVVVVAALVVLAPAIRIVQQYERGVLLRFGKLVGTRDPGFNLIIPYVDRMIKVDMRTLTWVLGERQEIITRFWGRQSSRHTLFQKRNLHEILDT